MPVATWKIVTLLGKRKEAPIQAQLGTRMQPNIYTHCPNDKDFVFIAYGEIRTKSLHHLPCSDTLLKEEKKRPTKIFQVAELTVWGRVAGLEKTKGLC